jgi:hypothetical protein
VLLIPTLNLPSSGSAILVDDLDAGNGNFLEEQLSCLDKISNEKEAVQGREERHRVQLIDALCKAFGGTPEDVSLRLSLDFDFAQIGDMVEFQDQVTTHDSRFC